MESSPSDMANYRPDPIVLQPAPAPAPAPASAPAAAAPRKMTKPKRKAVQLSEARQSSSFDQATIHGLRTGSEERLPVSPTMVKSADGESCS